MKRNPPPLHPYESQVHACCVRVWAGLSVFSRTDILRPLVLSVFFLAFFFESAVPHAAPMTGRETKKKRTALVFGYVVEDAIFWAFIQW